MIKYDYHMHSHHSGDSTTPTKDMVEAAYKLGLKGICFTEHYDPFFPYFIPEEKGMFELDLDKYFNEVDKLSFLYKEKLQILHGVEIGVQPDILDYCKEYIASNDFDFVIASSHVAGKIDPYYPIYFENRTVKEAISLYFNEILENVSKADFFDVYGHLDYVIRYTELANQINIKEYFDIIEPILKIIISKNKGIEINTGGFKTKLNRSNPHIDIVKLYKELGGEIITIGADAHTPDYIGSHFNDAEELLKECGFKYYTIFKQRKTEFVKI